jgi:hypothetical protein
MMWVLLCANVVSAIIIARYFYWRGWVHSHNVSELPHSVGAFNAGEGGGYGIAYFIKRKDMEEYISFLEKNKPLPEGYVYERYGAGRINDGSTRFHSRLMNWLVSR